MECGMGQEKCTEMPSGVTGFEGGSGRIHRGVQGAGMVQLQRGWRR